jgi:hypothetical protein
MKKDMEEITFGEVRTRFASPGSAVYAADVHLRADFMASEQGRLMHDEAERQVRSQRLAMQLEGRQRTGPIRRSPRTNSRRRRLQLEAEIQQAAEAELQKSPKMKTVVRPFTLDLGKRIAVSPMWQLDGVIQFRGMMPSDAA